MDNFNFRPVHDFVSRVLNTEAEIDFFGIKEEIRIKETYPAKCFGADD